MIQDHCPKCGWLYCGIDGGVCRADMVFSDDPTSNGDNIASYLRVWYEANRETWWERRKKNWKVSADNFMLGLMNEISRINDERVRRRMRYYVRKNSG